MQSASLSPSPTPLDDTNLNDSGNGAKFHATSKEPVVVAERDLAKNILDTVGEMLAVLRGSTIAQERGKDVESQFWATYKLVSNEHDNDFLERANDDMGIILTFAGLFSAVNSTFIVGMQPNPGDTTNALMLQLITVIAKGPGAVNINDLSSSTGYPPSTVWTQTLSYASLAFSVLAAFGAVMGKQWLNSYKAARGRGSLEERGMQRQEKLDGLERWKLKTVLGAFLILLQISLFLFGLSLSANMWSQQTTISSVIMSTMAFGLLSYGVTILLSVLRPDSPFQTPGSAFVKAIRNKFRPLKSAQPSKSSIKLSAIRWVLETSTNPEVVAAAAAMVPRVQWPKPDASAIYVYGRLLDNFATCLDRPELFVACGKAIAHLRVHSVNIKSRFWTEYDSWRSWRDRSRFIRDSFTHGRLACDQLKNTKDEVTEQKQRHKADARTALRTMLVYGMSSHLSFPDDEKLIWEGDLRWRKNNGDTPQYEEFDWLIDYLAASANLDDETQGDALLALSAMHGLGSFAKRPSYIQALIHCMGHTRPSRVRYAALRAVSDAREELCAIDSTQGVDTNLLDDLSRALLTATTSGQDVHLHPDRDLCYFRVISTLARSDEWYQRLVDHGHVDRCTSLLSYVLASRELSLDLSFYLAGIFARMDPSGGCSPLSRDQEWQTLMRNAWEKQPNSFLCRTMWRHCLLS